MARNQTSSKSICPLQEDLLFNVHLMQTGKDGAVQKEPSRAATD
jgi:hypothetical protein